MEKRTVLLNNNYFTFESYGELTSSNTFDSHKELKEKILDLCNLDDEEIKEAENLEEIVYEIFDGEELIDFLNGTDIIDCFLFLTVNVYE